MNENIVNFINNEALPKARVIFNRTLLRSSIAEERQRMNIIKDVITLYDSYDLIGCEQITKAVLGYIANGQTEKAVETYRRSLNDTRISSIACLISSVLFLKIIRCESNWVIHSSGQRGIAFMSLISHIADGMTADEILSWAVNFAAFHGIDLAPQIQINLFYLEQQNPPRR